MADLRGKKAEASRSRFAQAYGPAQKVVRIQGDSASMESKAEISHGKVKLSIADQAIAITSALSFVFVVLALCLMPFTNAIYGARDFVVYWATGQQLIHHANPYDADVMMHIERGAGLHADTSVSFMRNPPWALPITLPLGLFNLRLAGLLWALTLLASLLISIRLLRELYGRPDNYRHWLGAAFAPAFICLLIGQTALFALLGYVLFLYLHRSRPFWAGMSLWLCALKPHLFLVVGVVMLTWLLLNKSYKVLAGAAAALLLSCLATWLIDPAAWTQYAAMMRGSGIQQEPIPCIGIVLRQSLSPQSTWLQYLPAALGCAWGLVYFWKRRHSWEWLRDGGLLMLVSILVAPYSWIVDQVLAIPALLDGAYRTSSQLLLVLLVAATVLLEAELLTGVKLSSLLFLWSAPAWLVWYLVAHGRAQTANR